MLSIIIPCLNEETAIPEVAKLFASRLPLLKTHFPNIEILAVDDASTDNTLQVLRKHEDVFKTIHSKKRVGYGGAIKIGLSQCSGKYVGIMDMDATYDPADFVTLIQKKSFQNGEVLALGNRIHRSSALSGFRWVGNSLFKSMFRIALNSRINDPSCGIRIFDKSWLEEHQLDLPDDLSFAFATSVICAVQKKPFVQTDVRYYNRMGESKLSELQDGLRFLSVTWKLSKRAQKKSDIRTDAPANW